MQKKKHRRVNFRINHCSSQDPQYPVTELLLQSPDAKGWQSKRFSAYPQIVIIQLVEPTLLRQISFLSHQSKIASKIQIETKLQETKDWKKLGYISLTSNQNTNFQARQLRSANLNGIPSLLVKLTFRSNHVNSQNVFNQVGLISLSVYGDKMVESNFNVPSGMSQGQGQKTGGTLEFDKQTMNKLKELQIRKKDAVDNEQFDIAKNIKQEIQRIKNIGQTLILLEQKKQQSIKREDYETAKIINDQMKKMRDENQWGPPVSNKPSGNPIEYYNKQKTQNNYEEEEEHQSVSPMTNHQQRPKPMQQKVPVVAKKQPEVRNPPAQQKAPQKFNDPMDKPLNNGGYKPPQKIDMEDRPLDIKGNKGPSEYENEDEQNQGGSGEVEKLSKQIFGQCQQYLDVIDEEIFKCLYSKDHKNRETGVRMLNDKLGQRVQNRQGFIEAILFAIKCVIDDRIVSVLIGVLQLFDSFMRKMKPGANSNNLEYAEYIMEKICDYLGHANQKIVKISQTIYSNLPVYQLTSKDVCYRCLTMTYKRQKPPKILAARLKMIGKIVSEYQLGKNYQDTIIYVIKYIDDKNNDVRTAAINAIVAISSQMGYSSLQPFLKNVRPQIIKTIEEQMEGAEGDDRNYEDKPIKPKGTQNKAQSKNKNQIENENEFIDVAKNNQSQQDIKYCQYCNKFDPKFVQQNYIDMHFFHSCPVLTICLECKQTVEISLLTAHMTGECENSKYYKRCPRCKEAVHQKIYKAHAQKKQCLSAKSLGSANRCPLCHLDISPGADGWKQHLVDQGCENNPRQ